MLSLNIDDRPVDLPNDFSFTMNLKSPVFSEIGSYSYPFRIPATPKNVITMGYRHRVENIGDPYMTQEGAFFWNGLQLFKGTVKVKTSNSKYYEGTIFESEGDFFYSRQRLTLQQFDFGTMEFANPAARLAYINSCANVRYPDAVLAFPQIKNLTYWEEVPENWILQSCNFYTSAGISRYIPSSTTRTIIVPMLYLRYILKTIFTKLNYVFDDSFFASDSDYNSLALFNLVDCNTASTGYFKYDENKLFLNYHVPIISLNNFLSGLESFFNIRFFINNSTRTIRLLSLDAIVKSTACTDLTKSIISFSTELEDKIKGWDVKMTIDSDDLVAEQTAIVEKDAIDHIKDSVQSVALLPPWPSSEVVDMRFVHDEGIYYRMWQDFTWHPAPSDIGLVSLFTEVLYKDKDQSISTPFSTLFSDLTTGEGIIGNAMINWKAVTPKLFFMKYQLTGGSLGQPRDTANSSTATKNLFYNGDNSLFKQNFLSFLDFRLSTKLVINVAQLGFNDLRDFDFSRKYMFRGVKYLVKSIQVTLKKDKIMPATLECYACE